MLSLVSHNVTLFTLSVSAFLDQEPIIWQALLCSNHTMQFTHPHCPLGITALLALLQGTVPVEALIYGAKTI